MKCLIRVKSCFFAWLLNMMLIIAGLITFTVRAEEQQDARFYLQHIISARETLSFTGIFNYSRPDHKMERYVYQQITDDGKTKEWVKLSNLDEGFILVDKEVVCVTKGYKSKFRASSILQSLTRENIDNLLQDYDISLSEKELQVANRNAQELIFKAKDNYRYTYKLAFDKSTFFPLQYIFFDKDNKLLEQGHFSQFNPVSNDQVVVEPFATSCLKINKQQPKINQTNWIITWKPLGFNLEKVIVSQHNDEQLVYSDGLVYFSVFIEPLSDSRMSNLERYFGATVVISRQIDLPDNKKYFVTVVGEIPLSTAERIALSLHQQTDIHNP